MQEAEDDPRDTWATWDRSLKGLPPMYLMDGAREVLVAWDARCTATTTRGKRCRNVVVRGDEEFTWPNDELERDPLRFDDPAIHARIAAMLCPLHATTVASGATR